MKNLRARVKSANFPPLAPFSISRPMGVALRKPWANRVAPYKREIRTFKWTNRLERIHDIHQHYP